VLEVSITESPAQKVKGPDAVILTDGNALTLTIVLADVAEQPLLSVAVTEKVPEVLTVMDLLTELLLHR
jgi:hypothetical protein